MPIHVITAPDKKEPTQNVLQMVIDDMALPLDFEWLITDNLSNKSLNHLIKPAGLTLLAVWQDETLHLTILQLNAQGKLIKTALDWHKLQRRIVTAGRKSELILQASKLDADKRVLDATAGFGQDSLILASTGANVMMLECHPVMAMLLRIEQMRMDNEKNWQSLMSRLSIRYGDFLKMPFADKRFDVVYLDPMFPDSSFDAKVGKGMQLLHEWTQPPSLSEEFALLGKALSLADSSGKVIVKRPLSAPNLASAEPSQTFANDAIRFDIYKPLL